MNRFTLIFLAIGLVAVIGGVVIFNDLVHLRNRVRQAFSAIDVNLKKRSDLIAPLLAVLEGYEDRENPLFTELGDLETRIAAHDLTQMERLRAEEAVGRGLVRLISLAESHPELSASRHFQNLTRILASTEEQIATSSRRYNDCALAINDRIESFPANLVADLFGFRKHDFYERGGG